MGISQALGVGLLRQRCGMIDGASPRVVALGAVTLSDTGAE